DLRCELGGRTGVDDLTRALAFDVGEGDDPARATRFSPLAAHQVDRFALGDQDEELPEVVTVSKPRELPVLGPAAKAVECGKRHVFLVGRASRRAAQPRAS